MGWWQRLHTWTLLIMVVGFPRDTAVFIPRGWNHGVDDYSAKAV